MATEPRPFRHYPDSEEWADVQRRMAQGDTCAFEVFEAQAVERERQLEDYIQKQFYEPLVAGELGGGGGGGGGGSYFVATVDAYDNGTGEASVTGNGGEGTQAGVSNLSGRGLLPGYQVLVFDDGDDWKIVQFLGGVSTGLGGVTAPAGTTFPVAGLPLENVPNQIHATSGVTRTHLPLFTSFGPFAANLWLRGRVLDLDNSYSMASLFSSNTVIAAGGYHYNISSTVIQYVADNELTATTMSMPADPASGTWTNTPCIWGDYLFVFKRWANTNVTSTQRGLYVYSKPADNPAASWTQQWHIRNTSSTGFTNNRVTTDSGQFNSGWVDVRLDGTYAGPGIANPNLLFKLNGADGTVQAIVGAGQSSASWPSGDDVWKFTVDSGMVAVTKMNGGGVNGSVQVEHYTLAPVSAGSSWDDYYEATLASNWVDNSPVADDYLIPASSVRASTVPGGVHDEAQGVFGVATIRGWLVRDDTDADVGSWSGFQGIYDVYLHVTRSDKSVFVAQLPWRIRQSSPVGSGVSAGALNCYASYECDGTFYINVNYTTLAAFAGSGSPNNGRRTVTGDSTYASYTALGDSNEDVYYISEGIDVYGD